MPYEVHSQLSPRILGHMLVKTWKKTMHHIMISNKLYSMYSTNDQFEIDILMWALGTQSQDGLNQ